MMTRQEFRSVADANKAIRLRLPARSASVNVGFDEELDRAYRPGKGGREVEILLTGFVDYLQIDQRLNDDALFNVRCGGAALTLVRVSADPVATIDSFTCEPTQINAGETATLSWKTRNAEPVDVEIDLGGESVEPSGSLPVTPGETTTFTLVLAFADSRQEAAFFAWYAEDSYAQLRDRNLMLRTMKAGPIDPEGLSIDDLKNRLFKQWTDVGLFSGAESEENKNRRVLTSILREAVTDERRLSLSGVGLVKWSVKISDDAALRPAVEPPPWNLTDDEARSLLGYLLDDMRLRCLHSSRKTGRALKMWRRSLETGRTPVPCPT